MRVRQPPPARPIPPDPVMYLAAWPVVAAAVMCAGHSIESVPGLLHFLLAVCSVGIATSYWLRRIGADRRRVNLTVTGAGLILGIAAVVVDQEAVLDTVSWRWLMQSGIDGLVVTFLIRGVAWITAFRCFTLLTDLELVLSLGFSLSLFILVSVIEADAPLLAYYAAFAVGGLDLLLRYHARSLQQQVDRVVGRRVQPWRQEAGSVVALALGAALGTVVLTIAAGNVGASGWLNHGGAGLTDRVSRWFERLQGISHDVAAQKEMDVGGRIGANSTDEVFRVVTPAPELWRGNVYAAYDGRTWLPAADGAATLSRRGPGRFFVDGVQIDLRSSSVVRHRFTYVAPGAVVYNARNLVAIDVRPFRVALTTAGRVNTWPAMARGTVCRVFSLRDDAPGASQLALNRLDDAQRRRYLQLPAGLPDRVRDLARQVTAGATTPRQRMERLVTYLGASKLYTQRPGSMPLDADAVDWFLYEMPSGWCRHFATAAAILGRCVDVPTRLVDGYLPGTITAEREYVVRQRDAHVWCEAWLEGQGWASFDPTSLAETAADPLSQGLVTLQHGLDTLTMTVRERWPAAGPWRGLVLCGLLALAGWDGRRRGWLANLKPGRNVPVEAVALRLQRRLHKVLRRTGLSRWPHEPELVFAARAAARLPAARDELRAFSELLCEGRYSGRALAPAQLGQAEQWLARIAAAAAAGGRHRPAANRWVGEIVDGPGDATAA